MDLPEWEHRTKTAKRLHQRNVVILGLLVYQGITSGELAKLETSHVNLNEGKIYIPTTRKSNARHLKLQAGQVMAMQEYLDNYLTRSGQTGESWLFPGKKHSDMVAAVIRQVKKIHPEVTDARQIRSSVIMNWLKIKQHPPGAVYGRSQEHPQYRAVSKSGSEQFNQAVRAVPSIGLRRSTIYPRGKKSSHFTK